jgi:hypothetical protein
MLQEEYRLAFDRSDKHVIGLRATVSHESDTKKTIYYEYMVYNITKGPINRKESWDLTKLIETVSDFDLKEMIKKGTLTHVSDNCAESKDRLDKIID